MFELCYWVSYSAIALVGLTAHELLSSEPVGDAPAWSLQWLGWVIPTAYLVSRSLLWLYSYVFHFPELRRIAQGFWASTLRGVPFRAPDKHWIHGSARQIAMRICYIMITFTTGLIYRRRPWTTFSITGSVELGLLIYSWLVELLCGRYGWKPEFIAGTSFQPYQEVAWQHFFRESWVTRRCFGTSSDSNRHFARVLARSRMWWLGYLIIISFACLCGGVIFVASIVI